MNRIAVIFYTLVMIAAFPGCADGVGPPESHAEVYSELERLYPGAKIYGNPSDDRSTNYFVLMPDGSAYKISWNGFGDMFHYPYRDISEIVESEREESKYRD